MDTGGMSTVERRGRVHLVTLPDAGEHRLDPDLISALRYAVASVRTSASAGALAAARRDMVLTWEKMTAAGRGG